MIYQVIMIRSQEGYFVRCDNFPDCKSRGKTREETLQNMRRAISNYFLLDDDDGFYVEVVREEYEEAEAVQSSKKKSTVRIAVDPNSKMIRLLIKRID